MTRPEYYFVTASHDAAQYRFVRTLVKVHAFSRGLVASHYRLGYSADCQAAESAIMDLFGGRGCTDIRIEAIA
jgi:hypothetical protein